MKPTELSARLERLMNRRASSLRGSAERREPPPRFDARRPVGAAPLPSLCAGEKTLHTRLAQLRSGGPSAQPSRTKIRTPPISRTAISDDPPEASPVYRRPETPYDPSVAGRLNALLGSMGAAAPPPATPPDQARLMAALPGRLRPTSFGECYVIEEAVPLARRHGNHALDTALRVDPDHAAVLAKSNEFKDFDVRTALFFDLETTGLATTMGTLPFLIGAAHVHHDQLIMEQWLLRDPDEEAAALTDFAARIAEADWLVSFNGRSFDWPLLEARFAAHRIELQADHLLGHLDLLHAARRLVKHAVPNCKLQTLEAHLLGLTRIDDTPGSAVPATYHAYLRGGDPTPLIGVVKHNLDDVLSMLTLLGALFERVANAASWALRDPSVALAVAKLASGLGRLDQAEQVFTALAGFEATAAQGEKGLARVTRQRKRSAEWSGTRQSDTRQSGTRNK